MMNRIKLFLKRIPLFSRFLQRFYYLFRGLLEAHILGTKLQEWTWRRRKGNSSKVKEHYETVNHPHRPILVEKISSYKPLETILEIGCSGGVNLYLLAEKFPEAKLYGIDINSQFVKEGRKWLQKRNVGNVFLSHGWADRLPQFHNKSMDIVFTDATLLYIGPDKINRVIKEMKRIACKGIVFNEWHYENSIKEHLWLDGHWIYDYRILLSKYFPSDNIKISKIGKNDLWNDENWKKFGSIIEVRLYANIGDYPCL